MAQLPLQMQKRALETWAQMGLEAVWNACDGTCIEVMSREAMHCLMQETDNEQTQGLQLVRT